MITKKNAPAGRRSIRVNDTQPLFPPRVSTKNLLIEVGEQLFGLHGFDGISLREIAVAAGQANTNAVQYHFGDKMGLIVAIMDDRVTMLDEHRGELLQGLRKSSRKYARDLLMALWLPTLRIRSEDGTHTFARFLLQVMLHLNRVLQPLSRIYNSAKPPKNLPTLNIANTTANVELLKECFHHLPSNTLRQRMVSINLMFLSTIVEHDNTQREQYGKIKEFDLEPVLEMGLAILKMPA